MLQKALDNATASFGENDRRTQNWQIQLNHAKDSLNDMERELEETTQQADNMAHELRDSAEAAEKSRAKFEHLGTVLKTVGVVRYNHSSLHFSVVGSFFLGLTHTAPRARSADAPWLPFLLIM